MRSLVFTDVSGQPIAPVLQTKAVRDVTLRRLVITDVSGQPIAPIFQTKAVRDVTQRRVLLPTFRDNLSVPSSVNSLEDALDKFAP
jgi:hypothetical protein